VSLCSLEIEIELSSYSFLFYFFLIESLIFVIFLRVEIDGKTSLALAFISEALEVVNVILLSV